MSRQDDNITDGVAFGALAILLLLGILATAQFMGWL